MAPAELLEIDRWALARAATLQEEIRDAYRRYAFHLIYQRLHNFCSVELGAFYLDVLKDRMYTLPVASRARRSAQTAMYHIVQSMVRWLAPILSFTAEEIWQYLPGASEESVFLSTWHAVPEVPASPIDWPALLALRADVTRELEKLRDAGEIGAPLEAELDVYCAAEPYERFAALGAELRFFFITSHARVHRVNAPPAGAAVALNTGREDVWIAVKPTHDAKCVRCWQHRPEVGASAAHPQLCARCISNIEGPGEERHFI